MTALTDRLDEIEARAAAATDGPWGWHGYMETGATLATPGLVIGGFPTHELNILKTTDDWAPTTADAAFIAAARTDVPALTKALRAVLALHRPIQVPVVDAPGCVAEECDHDGGSCPATGRLTICGECDERCSEGYAYYAERGIAAAQHPCPTVRAITAALAGEA